MICSPGLNSTNLNGPEPDHVLAVARVALGILTVAVNMLGNNRQQLRGHRQQQRRVRLRQVQHCGVLIRRIYAFDRREHGLEGMVGLDRIDRKSHVFRGNRLAVVEGRPLHQVQSDSQTIIGHIPGLRQIRLRVPVLVKPQRRGE